MCTFVRENNHSVTINKGMMTLSKRAPDSNLYFTLNGMDILYYYKDMKVVPDRIMVPEMSLMNKNRNTLVEADNFFIEYSKEA